jgi:glycosyltransferase involved in cell wall biosynthesis
MSKKILIINWRSLNDPLSGGAEIATIEHAKRWVSKNNAEVFWLTTPPKNGLSEEEIYGVKFIYIGNHLPRDLFKLFFNYLYFYFLVIYTYKKKFQGRVDVVIDQVHGLPYLTPLYVKEKIILYIHEVAGSIWDKMYPFPINVVGKILEKIFFSFYKKVTIVSNSMSTKSDLTKILKNDNRIIVIKNGVSLEFQKHPISKYPVFTILYLNRIVRMKGIERAIEVISKLRKQNSDFIFLVAGKGEKDYMNFLKKKIKNMSIESNVKFLGFVNEKEKLELLLKSHLLFNPSYKEGWGMVNIEANACGTPVLAFDVPGNNESVIDGTSGFLVEDGNLEEMVSKILEIKNSNHLSWQKKCMDYSKKYDWDKLSQDFYDLL